MSRRIVRTIVAVSCLAVVLFGLPLALAVASLYHAEATQRLVDDAAQAATGVSAPRVSAGDPVDLAATADGASIGLYGPDGVRIAGAGPARADAVVRTALSGHIGSTSSGDESAAAVPVGAQEQVAGAVRAALPTGSVNARVYRAWLGMLTTALAALVVTAVIARRQSRRLARPLEVLNRGAVRLGDGDFSVRVPASGIAETDSVAAALNSTAERLGQVLERERAFSADASHQLRTPLTALRVRLESAVSLPGAAAQKAVVAALPDLARLEAIVENLLRLARDAPADRGAVRLDRLLGGAEAGWRGRLTKLGRRLDVEPGEALWPVAASESAVREILEVLLDNAVVHGAGTVRVVASEVGGMATVEVGDEGAGVTPPLAAVFARRSSGASGTGIGLALARSLAEAEGGRLLLSESEGRQVFRLLLPVAAGDG